MRHRSQHSSTAGGDALIEKAAGDWIARLDRGLSPREAADFAAWEAADPRHAAELSRLKATWHSLDTADEVPEIMQLAQEIDEKQNQPWRTRWRRSWTLVIGGAAAAAVILGWAMSLMSSRTVRTGSAEPMVAARTYKVVPSAAQRLTLADGTVVELNADSAVEPAFSPEQRLVRLVRGEAHFAVARDAVRPFVVQAGHVAVRAVGTAFNVRFASAAIEVLVTHGKVRVDDAVKGESLISPLERVAEVAATTVEAPVLVAGQRILISDTMTAPVAPTAITPAEIERALAWQGTQLIFGGTSLEEAVAAFNSFNRQQLLLGDASLRTRRLGGTFRADNLDAFVRLLETGFEISAEPRGENQIVLRAAR
jgi:transmembrane sensor